MPGSLLSLHSQSACRTGETETRKTTLPVMPQDTALGFPSSSPPLPHGSERSTSGFGTNQHPAAAIDRPFWVLLRSSASLRFFQKPGFAFGGVVQVFPGHFGSSQGSSLLWSGRDFSVEVWSSRRARRACGTGQGNRLPESWPGADIPFLPFPIAASQTRVWVSHGGYGSERPPRGGRSGK